MVEENQSQNYENAQDTSALNRKPQLFRDRRDPHSAMLGLQYVPSWLVREALKNESEEE